MTMNDSVVKSAARVLEVFEYFANRRGSASVSEVCAALGYPQSSTSVLLKSLLTLGYLAYDGNSRRYMPTERVALLGGWMNESAAPLAGLLAELRSATGMTAVLSRQTGIQVEHFEVAAVDGIDCLAAGMSSALAHSAAGRVLLASMADAQVLRLARRVYGLDQLGSPVNESDLLAAVAAIRRDGYELADGEVAPGFATLSVIAPVAAGQPALALSIVGPSERVRRERVALLGAMQRVQRNPAAAQPAPSMSGPESAPVPMSSAASWQPADGYVARAEYKKEK